MSRWIATVVLAGALAVGSVVECAQRSSPSPSPQTSSRIEPTAREAAAAAGYDGGFRFCRIRFRTSPLGDGNGWYVDYPRADENLSVRVSELTNIPVTTVGEGTPVHIVIGLTDPELFQCPFVRSHITSERGADSAQAHGRAIFDHKGHAIVFMTFNTDFGDAFEQESVSPDYFERFSVPAYEIGADVIIYALTH